MYESAFTQESDECFREQQGDGLIDGSKDTKPKSYIHEGRTTGHRQDNGRKCDDVTGYVTMDMDTGGI